MVGVVINVWRGLRLEERVKCIEYVRLKMLAER